MGEDKKFVQGKIYLKQKSTGVIWEFEKLLEKHEDFEPVVPNPLPNKDKLDKAAKDIVESIENQ